MSRFSRFVPAALAALALLFGTASTAFADGGVVEQSETVISKEKLPDDVPDGFEQTEYASWPIVERARVESEDHGTIYEIEVQKDDKRRGLFFSSEGKLLDIEVETPE